MGQYHCVVNLDKGSAIEPWSMGEFTKLMEFGHGGATMASLVYLLAEGWSGERVAIIGDYAEAGDLSPKAEAALGFPVQETWSVMDTKGDKRIQRQSWMARGVLSGKGIVEFEKDGSRYVQKWADDAELETAPADDRGDVVVLNLDKLQMLDPKGLGDTGSLRQMAVFGGAGGSQTALAVLLASSCRGGSRGGGDIREGSNAELYVDVVGSWAGDRIAIVDREDLIGTEWDVTATVRELLVDCKEGKFSTDAEGNIVRDREFWV